MYFANVIVIDAFVYFYVAKLLANSKMLDNTSQ